MVPLLVADLEVLTWIYMHEACYKYELERRTCKRQCLRFDCFTGLGVMLTMLLENKGTVSFDAQVCNTNETNMGAVCCEHSLMADAMNNHGLVLTTSS